MEHYRKPTPMPDRVTEKFWEAARRHTLLIQRCRDCQANLFFPQSVCRRCLSEDIEWLEAKGTGEIYSFTVIHRPPSMVFEDETPYVVAIVELDEGVRMMTNIIGIESEAVRIGMNVEVVFDDVSPTISLPKFRPTHTEAKPNMRRSG